MLKYVFATAGIAVSFGAGYWTGRKQSVKEYTDLLYILDNKTAELVNEVEALKKSQQQQQVQQQGVNHV